MTVIKRNRQNFNYPNSANVSDTESLHLGNSVAGSDTESLNNEPIRVHRRPTACRPHQVEELLVLKKSSGKKKLRRYENRSILQTLSEEDENEAGFVVIMEPSKAPLTRLLEDSTALAYWNDFIDQSEEDQIKIMEEFSAKIKRDSIDFDNNKTAKIEKTFKRIPSRIRHTIKVRKDVSLEFIKKCEEEFVSFFKETPDDVIVKICSTSFEKVLVYAVALYHRLSSECITTDKQRIMNVCNPLSSDWTPADCFLTDFIAQLKR